VIIIAESGSTKCDWAIVEQNGTLVTSFSTMGFNPYFHSKEFILKELHTNRGHFPPLKRIEKVFFYGAGCSAPHLNKIIQDSLEFFFQSATVEVDHDLVGAAYSTFTGQPAIACILGTGSNSCYFDGKKIEEEVPSLAYILGDEGSGSYFGKQMLQDYFYKRLPAALSEPFKKEFEPTKDKVIQAVYNEPFANVYLASYMHFVSSFKEHPYINKMLLEGFSKFLEIHVECFKKAKELPINFVGSVAHYNEDILREAAESKNLNINKIDKKPISGLIDYHLKYKLELV
jgi:glucosamine kinase